MLHTIYDRTHNHASKTAHLTCDVCGKESRHVAVDAARDVDDWDMIHIRPKTWGTFLEGRMRRDCCPACAKAKAE